MNVWLPVLIFVGLLVLVGSSVLLFFVMFSFISGWGRLAQVHAAVATPIGRQFRSIRGQVGVITFKGLSATVCADGLHLRFVMPRFYPPLFIPWSAVAALDTSTGLLSFGTAEVKLLLRDPGLPRLSFIGKPAQHIVDSFKAERARVAT